MPATATKLKRKITWSEYQTWPEGERWEIINGEAFDMSPSPTSDHQWAVSTIWSGLNRALKGTACNAFFAPLDIRFSEDNCVEPDVFVICDPAQDKRSHIEGPPALAVEVLSPSSTRKDRLLKLDLYARFGVKEYWLVDTVAQLVEVMALREGAYQIAGVYERKQTLKSPLFPKVRIPLKNVFRATPAAPAGLTLVKEAKPPPYRTAPRSIK